MRITLLHDHYDPDHLSEVIETMRNDGTPTIRVYTISDEWYQAIEGSHRLRACEILNINPKIVVLDPDTPLIDKSNTQIIDWDGPLINCIGELGDVENYSILFYKE